MRELGQFGVERAHPHLALHRRSLVGRVGDDSRRLSTRCRTSADDPIHPGADAVAASLLKIASIVKAYFRSFQRLHCIRWNRAAADSRSCSC